jgi:hypothetical protein
MCQRVARKTHVVTSKVKVILKGQMQKNCLKQFIGTITSWWDIK